MDDKANSYFQAIYNRGMSVDRLLDELKKFKDSPIKKDRVSYSRSPLFLRFPFDLRIRVGSAYRRRLFQCVNVHVQPTISLTPSSFQLRRQLAMM